MAFRNLIISSPAQLSVRSGRLVVRTDAEHALPLEDISAILLESRQCSITTAALSRLGQCGCAVFLCDERHMPCAVLTPFQQHSRAPAVLQSQLEAAAPFKKRLWQAVVKAKIRNQAQCLQLAGNGEAADALFAMVGRVRSGDTENVEATAAQLYFPALFGAGFTRSNEDGINAGLNYGYAILRGCMARALTVYGFQPALGIHHRSGLNAFNLADDMMEPFRPLVDLLVLRGVTGEDELTPVQKQLLFNCLNLDVLVRGSRYSVAYAMELAGQSLSRSFGKKEAGLDLPLLLDPKQHRYE